MKKTKKSGPKAFGVRLEECQPGANNKVSLECSETDLIMITVFPITIFLSVISPSAVSVHPDDRGDLLWSSGGNGSGIHRNLPCAGEQRHGVNASGPAQQGRRHQPCRGGEEQTKHPGYFHKSPCRVNHTTDGFHSDLLNKSILVLCQKLKYYNLCVLCCQ